jgi:hypothetical protein
MRPTEGQKPNGIRTIFASAMAIDDEPDRTTGWFGAFDAGLARHALGGALFGLAVVAIAGFAVAGFPARDDETPTAAERAAGAPLAAVKADRETIRGAIEPDPVRTAIDLVDSPDLPFVTIATQRVARAATDPRSDAAVAIDAILLRPPILTAALTTPQAEPDGRILGPIATPTIAEDDDEDEAELLPMPRPRPADPVTAMPLPKARPNILLAALDPARSAAPADEEAEEDASAPPPPRSSNVLGFFSSPSEPVQQPKIRLDTPFGVPYEVQTASVETACLKPQLVDILRRVESHYHRKAVITSGYRARGRDGSMHRQCAAADIEIPGVGAAALAAFARTLPEVGGVGTYCHPELVHIDVGTPRDWKYGCGSFFAMRGSAPGRWGKVPPSLAKYAGAAKGNGRTAPQDGEIATE